jgi:hypothetical protein
LGTSRISGDLTFMDLRYRRRVTLFPGFSLNLTPRSERALTLREADRARTDLADQRLTLSKGQRFKLRIFLAFAKLLRWCRLV